MELMGLLEHLELRERLKLISLNNSIKTFYDYYQLIFQQEQTNRDKCFLCLSESGIFQLRHDFSLYLTDVVFWSY
jgi:hypothetical protein